MTQTLIENNIKENKLLGVMMLTINIDNPELEQSIHQTYGSNKQSIAKAFMEFIQQQKIKKDIGISIQQLDAGEGIPVEDVFNEITAKYE